MPAGKRQQSNTMLYTVIVFVALFLVSTVFAVVFYVRSEDYRTREDKLKRDMANLANGAEQSRLSAIVGDKPSGATYLGALSDYHRQASLLIMGQPVDENPAEIRTDLAYKQVETAIGQVQPFIDFEKVDPNTGLVPVVNKLVQVLKVSADSQAALQQQIDEMQKDLDSTKESSQAKVAMLESEKQKYQSQAEEVLKRYEELKLAWEQSGDDRVNTVKDRLDRLQVAADELKQSLVDTQAQLDITHGRMAQALEDLREVEPVPSLEAMTFVPDGKITLVDEVAGVVYLNLGSKDRIFKGLTFSVYDKASAIPKDGKAKAEVEIYKVMESSAAARIVSRDPRNPIATDDAVANLIWDRDKAREFVIAGEFDLDDDGFMEADAAERITALIERWGGRVAKKVSADTHVVLLGSLPAVPDRPTFEDLEVDPLAQDRYDAAQQRLAEYQGIHESAKDFMIPMYKYEKFLYLIGYKGSVTKPGAFL